MKKLMIILLVVLNQAMADEVGSKFFEPSISNKYQGRLFSANNSYPIEKMKKLCEAFTGIDTAQIKCKKQENGNAFICEYKCSLHWMTDEK
tara:strand:+ start:22374 stop:22646 length:273 start_codon:yes stop_codon:yes gene_type:complete